MNTLKLKARIVESGKTLGKLAEFLSISPSTMTNKMSGKTEFTRKEMLEIRSFLNLSYAEMAEIFFGD